MKNVLEQFKTIHVYAEQGKPSLHKPVLLLYALAQCHHKKDRLLNFRSIDEFFKQFFLKFSIDGKYENSHYPFGKLENDGVWEIIDSKILKRTSVGHLSKSELLYKNIHGGFTVEIYNSILNNKSLIEDIVSYLLKKYFNNELHQDILHFLEIDTNNENQRNQKMALIGNETFALSRWQARKTIELIRSFFLPQILEKQ